jgi:hypothetical protein
LKLVEFEERYLADLVSRMDDAMLNASLSGRSSTRPTAALLSLQRVPGIPAGVRFIVKIANEATGQASAGAAHH